ncbi:restriction endonuclease subunit S [Streptococcus macedonicus]|uniref:restriction endonuclease subunit S n=1 Tax=Streptococcus macedonicus TaxID=59310 RepID=UPI0004D880B2|nr:restriction endonuclease subunit S [Streptococcus macedonicus]KEH52164.1 hypothetical protein FD61_06155 [Streptococcus macedonicus]
MSEKATKIPQIRFDGYTDAWEQRKLDNLATFSKGSGYSKGDLVEEGSPIILYGRLYTKYETLIKDVDTFVLPKGHSVISEGNEVIVPASGETSEDISRAAVVDKSGILLGGDLNIIKPKSKLNSVFLALTISNGSQQKELSKRAQGNSVVHLYNSELKKVNLYFPSLEEQQKIGAFFQSIDDTITLHQRECDLLAKMKKSYLQKMFPKNGEDKPEIRFDGYTDAWEQRKLGDCCEQIKETVDPQQNPDVKYWEYSMPAFDNGNKPDLVYGSGMNSIRKVINTSCLLINKLNVRKKRIWLVETPLNNSVCSAEFVPIVSENVDLRFIKYIVSENKFTRYLEDCSSGSSNSQKRVTPDVIMSAVIKVPTIAEQQKVGEYFSNLDRLITLHQRELDSLKKMKKSLLQMMFV